MIRWILDGSGVRLLFASVLFAQPTQEFVMSRYATSNQNSVLLTELLFSS